MKRFAQNSLTAIAVLAITCGAAKTSNGDDNMTDTPLCISGIRPHLTVYNRPETLGDTRYEKGGGEVGIGAVVPWAGKLWMVTYPQHDVSGGSDKLWTVDENFAQEMRPDHFVAMAAYGDYGPGYIGTSIAYTQGGYETGIVSRVAPEVEQVLTDAMQTLLQAN